MASAFDVDRKKLGLLGSSQQSSSKSAFDADRVKLGLMQAPEEEKKSLPTALVLEDTLKSVTKPAPKTVDFKAEQAKKKEAAKPAASSPLQGKLPAAELLQTNQGIQQTLQGKVPAAELVQQTGRGPENASQIPGISQYEINKKEIESAPPVVKQYAQVMNYLTEGNPLGIALGNAFSGNSGATRKDSSGNQTVDKVAEIVNNLVTPFITPTGAPVRQGIIGSTYGATEKALSGKVGQKILGAAEKVIPGSQNVARVAATEGIAGGLQGVGFGLQQGQDSGNEIGRNAALGAAAGGVLGGAGAALGEAFPALLNMFRKSGIADDEIAEIAPELLALPEAQPRTIRKQLAGEIKTTSNTDPIVNPYTFKLDEASPQTQRAASNAAEGRTAVRDIDNQINDLTNSYEQAVIDEYKALKEQRDNPQGVNQGQLFTDAEGNVTGRQGRLSNNPRWYQEAMKENNYQKLSNKKLYELARKHVDEGFNTEAGRAPGWRQENNYDEQLQALQQVRETLSKSVNEIDSPLKLTDAPTKTQKLKDTRINGKSASGSEPVIRSTELSREQQLMNKVNAKQPLTQADIDFAMSSEFDQSKLFPETTPTESTYVKPRQAEPVKAKVAKKATVDKTIVTEAKKEVSTTAKKKQTPGIRANYKTMTDSNAISPTLKGKIAELDQKYATLKNADVVAKSNAQMQDIAKVEADFLKSGSTGAQHISNGYRAMQELDKAGEHARALAIADKLAKDLTEAGQTVQAASLISRLSPEGQLLNLIRTAEKNGKVVDLADSVKFKKLAETVQEAAGAGKQENAIADILNRLEAGGASADDIKALGDYLKTAERKIKAKPVKDRLPKELNDVKKRDKVISFLEAQEAAAQARINKRRGRLNSMPVDEWIDYSILIAAKVGKGIIKAETHIEDLVKLFGEDIRPLATQVFEKAQELVGSVTKGTLEGDFIKADNAFKRITGKASMNQQERVVEKYVAANPEVTPKDIESLRKLSKSLTELQGLERTKADIAMQKILVSYEKSSVNDKVNALRYMAMLLNDSTQAINALSGPIMSTWGTTIDVIGTMMDIAMRGTLKTQRSTTLYGTNPLRFMADYFKYAKVGGKAGWEGVSPSGIQGTNEIRGLAFKSKKNPFGIAERTLGAVAKGADYATYKTVYESELRKQGFLDALENGIKRSDKEGIKNHVRKFMNDPPEAAMEQADRIGKNTTFQRNDSVGGKTANWINSAPKGVKPVVNAVVPFVRTPLNIASSAVTATPVGIVKGLFQLSSLSKASQREAIRTLSMGIVGTGGVTSLGYYLSSIGIITGANDTGNKDVNSINEQAGRGKYRFNTSAMKRYMLAMINGEGADAAEKAAKYQKGDKAFDYNKLQPLAFPLAIGAGLQRQKGGIAAKVGAAGKDAYGSLFGMSSLKGIQDTFQPQFTGTQGDKALNVVTRVVESYFKSFSPSALAQEARRIDPVQRKTAYNEGLTKDLLTYYTSRIPVLSKTLPANKDTLGNTKLNSPGFSGQHLNPYKSEVANYSVAAEYLADLIERTGNQTIAPSAPPKYIEGYNENDEKVKITLPTKRYEQLQEELGSEITRRIIEIETDDDNEAIELIKEIYSEAKEEQREKLRDEFGLYSK